MNPNLLNIFVISTEHQLIQVYEAINIFNIRRENIVLIIFNNDNKKWFNRIANFKSYKSIILFNNWTVKDLLLNKRQINEYILFLNDLSIKNNGFVLFVSQYYNDSSILAYTILKPIIYYLMDEGTTSFAICLKRRKFDILKVKLLLKSVLYYRKLNYPKSINFFSQYPLIINKNDNLTNFSFKVVNNSHISFIHHKAILLGTSLVELKLMNENNYLDLLKEIKQQFNYNTFYYYSHRKENIQKLKKIQSIGYIVKANTKPFEFVFQKFKNYPDVIYSFNSPILDTLSKKYSNLPKLIILSFNLNLLKRERKITKIILDSFSNNPNLTIYRLNLKDEKKTNNINLLPLFYSWI